MWCHIEMKDFLKLQAVTYTIQAGMSPKQCRIEFASFKCIFSYHYTCVSIYKFTTDLDHHTVPQWLLSSMYNSYTNCDHYESAQTCMLYKVEGIYCTRGAGFWANMLLFVLLFVFSFWLLVQLTTLTSCDCMGYE